MLACVNKESKTAFERLREQRLASAQRPYLARGIHVERCESCRLGRSACLCAWRQTQHLPLDCVLLLHPDEVFKPTNTGRLVADCFPRHTHAFIWDRTQPAEDLRALLADPQRLPLIVFPGDRCCWSPQRVGCALASMPGAQLTLILLDGTWRQARRMYRLSPWLRDIPTLELPHRKGGLSVRKAARAEWLSTAEATAAALQALDYAQPAQLLAAYFAVFDHHYRATRSGCTPSVDTPAHTLLAGLR